jgi:tRNA(Arg) A34 adenosine deaminase TadA
MTRYQPKEEFMELSIQEATACRKFGDHPVGALIVQGSEVISKSGNRTHRDMNPTHHAEVVAIGLASKRLRTKNLSNCILYTTHEPCPMCAAASVYARLGGIVFGTSIDDAVRFVEKHPQVSWRSIGISLPTMIYSGDNTSLFIIEGFMKKQCASLFNLLLTVNPTIQQLTSTLHDSEMPSRAIEKDRSEMTSVGVDTSSHLLELSRQGETVGEPQKRC